MKRGDYPPPFRSSPSPALSQPNLENYSPINHSSTHLGFLWQSNLYHHHMLLVTCASFGHGGHIMKTDLDFMSALGWHLFSCYWKEKQPEGKMALGGIFQVLTSSRFITLRKRGLVRFYGGLKGQNPEWNDLLSRSLLSLLLNTWKYVKCMWKWLCNLMLVQEILDRGNGNGEK